MKLYAKVASERASEGQGGNEYLHIDIYGGSTKVQIPIGRVVVEVLPTIDYESKEEYTKDRFDVEVIYVDDTQQVRYRAVKKVNTELRSNPQLLTTQKGEKLKTAKVLCNSCDDFGRGKEPDKDCPTCNE